MENKEIYIYGVDVSGCDFYDKNKKYCLTLKMDTKGFKNPSCFSGDFQECIQDSKVCPYTFCDNNPNCYYKQLKRKEQECERLKEKLCSFENCTNFEKYGKEIAKLKQTLNEIKQIAIREFETSRYNGSFTWKQILQKISECEGNDE